MDEGARSSTDRPIIGPYRCLELLGRGGMGEVWLAEQTEPVHRRVALKIIRLGMDTKDFLARLEAERQALAVMDHPNIARFYDGGATETGRPYFVMELVHGVPITEYCDVNRLTTDERIRLFLDVCQAVQHAHHKGVVHRDLKPSNVLATVVDQKPVVKVIDFGIAKALGRDLTDRTLVTRAGQILGTPEYMSPEQAEMTGLDVDTRTDVYSLGVMLYELLVGARPFDLGARADEAIRYAIRETEVPRPSTRLTGLGQTQETVARCRRTTAEALRRELRNDLDWVILRAMEKDRTRRYETVHGLALDLDRHLHSEPVLARAPSRGYRLQKFVKRHRVGVTAGATVAMALVAGLALATVGMLQARRAERRAEQEAEASRQVSDFLVELFQVSDPSQARGEAITAREILDRGAERIDTELKDQPEVRARLLFTMGRVYTSLGLYKDAGDYLEDALSIRERLLNPGDQAIAQSLEALGMLDWRAGRFPEGAERLDRALQLRTEAFGPSDPHVASTLKNLGTVSLAMGNYDEARSCFQRAVDIYEETLDPEDPELARALNGLGNVLRETGPYDEALPVTERVLGILEKTLPRNHPDLATALNNLAVQHARAAELDTARSLFERVLTVREEVFGPEHPEVAAALSNLGLVETNMGNPEAARDYLQRAFAIQNEVLDSSHPDLAATAKALGDVLLDLGELEEARVYYQRALEVQERVLGPNHPLVASTLVGMASVYHGTGDLEEAEATMARAAAIFEESLGPDHPNVGVALENLAQIRMDMGRYEEAEPPLARALRIQEAALGAEHPYLAGTLDQYVRLLRHLGRLTEASEMAARAQAIRGEGGGGLSPLK